MMILQHVVLFPVSTSKFLLLKGILETKNRCRSFPDFALKIH